MKKNFFKFWWDEELTELKQQAILSCRAWKTAGKPRNGPIFRVYKTDKLAYKAAIRSHQREATYAYTNDLHEALLQKQGTAFWKCWRSKFECNKQPIQQVDGIVEPVMIADYFAEHFSRICSNSTGTRAAELKSDYEKIRVNYSGWPDLDEHKFDACLVEGAINTMRRGKAAGLDSITSEHLQYCHALLPCVLSKLFNLMVTAVLATYRMPSASLIQFLY